MSKVLSFVPIGLALTAQELASVLTLIAEKIVLIGLALIADKQYL